MNVLIIGDVHGCYHTFKTLIDNYWNKDTDFLVQVGDLVNKGLHSGLTLQYFWKLQKKYPYQVFMTRGNNEQFILDSYKNKSTSQWYIQIKDELKKSDIRMSKFADWIEVSPLKWETPHMIISHAGVAKTAKNPFYVNSTKSVLHNRSVLKNLEKVQVHGHDMLKSGKAEYTKESLSWNIDTGAWTGDKLSGIRLNRKGNLLDLVEVRTNPLDYKTSSKKISAKP